MLSSRFDGRTRFSNDQQKNQLLFECVVAMNAIVLWLLRCVRLPSMGWLGWSCAKPALDEQPEPYDDMTLDSLDSLDTSTPSEPYTHHKHCSKTDPNQTHLRLHSIKYKYFFNSFRFCFWNLVKRFWNTKLHTFSLSFAFTQKVVFALKVDTNCVLTRNKVKQELSKFLYDYLIHWFIH